MIELMLHKVRETKNTVRYEQPLAPSALEAGERPLVFYAKKDLLPFPYPEKVKMSVQW